jgi:hypothetical protein
MQLPFRVDRASEEEPNWEVVIPPPCPAGCRATIEELVAEFGARYELKASESLQRSA